MWCLPGDCGSWTPWTVTCPLPQALLFDPGGSHAPTLSCGRLNGCQCVCVLCVSVGGALSVSPGPAASVLSHLLLLHIGGTVGISVSKLRPCPCPSLFRACLAAWPVQQPGREKPGPAVARVSLRRPLEVLPKPFRGQNSLSWRGLAGNVDQSMQPRRDLCSALPAHHSHVPPLACSCTDVLQN